MARTVAWCVLLIVAASTVAFSTFYAATVAYNTVICQSEDSSNCLWVDLGTDGGGDRPVIQWNGNSFDEIGE